MLHLALPLCWYGHPTHDFYLHYHHVLLVISKGDIVNEKKKKGVGGGVALDSPNVIKVRWIAHCH